MTNMLHNPLSRTLQAGRHAAATMSRVAESTITPVVGPLARPLASMTTAVCRAAELAPALAAGAFDRLGERIPHVIANRLPATNGDVEALAARVVRLESVPEAKSGATAKNVRGAAATKTKKARA